MFLLAIPAMLGGVAQCRTQVSKGGRADPQGYRISCIICTHFVMNKVLFSGVRVKV